VLWGYYTLLNTILNSIGRAHSSQTVKPILDETKTESDIDIAAVYLRVQFSTMYKDLFISQQFLTFWQNFLFKSTILNCDNASENDA
jgi:hypothetical protein